MMRLMRCVTLCVSTYVVAGAWGGEPAAPSDEGPVMLFPIVKGGKWGYMDEKGKVVIEPQYDGAWDFSEGLACVGVGLQRGYIDKTGVMAIKPRFGWAGSFHSGMAAVFGHGDGKPIGARAADIWGDDVQMYKPQAGNMYIDRTGKGVSGGQCSPVDFSEGKVCRGATCIGTDGNELKHDAEGLGWFSEGLLAARKAGKWGYMDHSMKWVIEPQFDLAGPFGDGLAAVARSDVPPPKDPKQYSSWRRASKKLKWGYIDKDGKLAIDYHFNDADRFSEGMAAVMPQIDMRDQSGGAAGSLPEGAGSKWGHIDKNGALAGKAEFDYAWRFSDGLGRVMVREKFGYVDKKGRFAIEPRYDSAWEFSKRLARVCVGTREGYIDHEGKYVWEPTE